MKLRITMLLMLLVGSTTALAHEGEHKHEHEHGDMPAGEMMGMGGDRTMFRGGGIGTIGLIAADLPTLGIAYLPIDHVMIAVAVSLQYNGNNAPSPFAGLVQQGPIGLVLTPGNWQSGILVAIEYMIHDQMPFAMGPAFAFRGSFAPGAFFSSVQLMPSWDLWYTPFNAPLAIGTSLGVLIQLNAGANPIVSLLTPGMRVAYTF
jgi:hypothetical protein